MLFRDFIAPTAIVGDLVATGRNDALTKMVNFLCQGGLIPATAGSGMLSALIQREEINPTVVTAGVAVPHAKHPAVRKLTGLLARSRSGINFVEPAPVDNPDAAKPVTIFILLLSNHELVAQHLEALAYIATTFLHPENKLLIESAYDEKGIFSLLNKIDENPHGTAGPG